MTSSESSYYSSDDSDDYWYHRNDYTYKTPHAKADELPDPEKDSSAVLLGEFTAPVKASHGNTIEGLKENLVSCGISYQPDPWVKLCLDSLFDVGVSNKPKNLTFDVPGCVEAEETYIIPIEILQPGLKALNALLEIPASCSAARVRQCCEQQLIPALQQTPHSIVLLWRRHLSPYRYEITAVQEDENIKGKHLDETQNVEPQKELLVCWLPKAPEKKGKKAAATPAAQAEQHYSKQYVLIQHVFDRLPYCNVLVMPMKDSLVHGGSRQHTELQTDVGKFFTKECRHSRLPSHRQLHFVRGNYTSGHPAPRSAPVSFTKHGEPVWLCPDVIQHLLVEGTDMTSCGHCIPMASIVGELDHETQTTLAYEMESRADARDERQALQRRVKLLRRLPWYDVLSELRIAARKLHSSYNFSFPRPVCAVKLSLECPNPLEPRRGLLHCKVYTWKSVTAAHGSLLSSPTSISAAANTIREPLPGFIVHTGDIVSDAELSDSGYDSDYEDDYGLPGWLGQLREGTLQVPNLFRPVFAAPAAAAATTAAAGAGGSSSGSTAAVAPAAAASSSAAVGDTPFEVDPALVEAERLRRLYRSGKASNLPLRMTIRMMTKNDSGMRELYEGWMQSMDVWWKAEKSIKGLLDMLKTGPCESAPQPAGLSVTLHPHQLQTLSRLLARERAPLGFNSLLWHPFESAGRQWWVSLVLSKLSLDAPPAAVTGGFLADEMGLGKTISILALILANPAPEEHITQPQQQQDAAGRAGSSRQAAAQSREPIVTKPGQRLPQLDSKRAVGGKRNTAAAATMKGSAANKSKQKSKAVKDGSSRNSGESTAAATKGKRGRKRKRPDRAEDEDAIAADPEEDADQPAAAAAAAAGRGKGSTRGRGRGRGRGRVTTPEYAELQEFAQSIPVVSSEAELNAVMGTLAEIKAKCEAKHDAMLDAASAAALSSPISTGLLYSRATLVVCAVSLVGQWIDEALDKTKDSLRIYKYHGPGRDKATLQQLAADYDVVVTTYQTLVSDVSQHEQPPLQQIQWWRVVFDEGHTLKNASSATTKAATALAAKNRWVVTGTPIATDVSDLAGQMAALQLWPFNLSGWFQEHCKYPFSRQFIRHPSNQLHSPLPLVYVLRHIMTRHTKDQQLEGQAVLQLPNKTVTNVPVVMNPEETAIYKEVYARVRSVWLTLAAAGPGTINKHLLQAMSLLLPLRRICSGGRLTRNDLQVRDIDLSQAPVAVPTSPSALAAAAAATSTLLTAGLPSAGVAPPDEQECVVCLDCLEVPVVTPCGHWFCKECIVSCLQTKHNCPLCRAPLAHKDLRAGLQPAAGDSPEDWTAAAANSELGDIVVCDSKLKVLLKELAAMRAADPTSKALVFTQYNSTLEWLKKALPAVGFGYRSISGSMPLTQRTKAIEAFQRDPPTTVFLLSVRSGAVGINLTAASHVFLLEPCLNPALEDQAIGRAWRMGQQREVTVKRLFVKGSVEERIMALAESRRSGAHIPGTSRWAETSAAAAAAAGPSNHGRAGSSAAAAAATQQQLAGSIKADTQKLRAAELEHLFAAPSLPRPVSLPPGPSAAAGGVNAAEGQTAGADAAAAVAGGGGGGGNAELPDVSVLAAAAAAATAAAQGCAGGQLAATTAAAAAAATAVMNNSAAATAAAEQQRAAYDVEVERKLAIAGLLAGSKRAAAWADEIAAAAAARGVEGPAAAVTSRPRRAAVRARRANMRDSAAAAAAAETSDEEVSHGRRRRTAVAPAAQIVGRRRSQPAQRAQQLGSFPPADVRLGYDDSSDDDSSDSDSSESESDSGFVQQRSRCSSPRQRPGAKAMELDRVHNSSSDSDDDDTSDDSDDSDEYSQPSGDVNVAIMRRSNQKSSSDSEVSDSSDSDSSEDRSRGRRSASLGAAVGAVFNWMAAAVSGRGRQGSQPPLTAAAAAGVGAPAFEDQETDSSSKYGEESDSSDDSIDVPQQRQGRVAVSRGRGRGRSRQQRGVSGLSPGGREGAAGVRRRGSGDDTATANETQQPAKRTRRR